MNDYWDTGHGESSGAAPGKTIGHAVIDDWDDRAKWMDPGTPETALVAYTREFGARSLRMLRELLPPMPVTHQDFVGPEYDELFDSFVAGDLVELVDPPVTRPECQLVRLTQMGRAIASATKPTFPDYTVERGGGTPSHPCRRCGTSPSTRSVRIQRPGLGSSRLMDSQYFCEQHAVDAEATYHELRALYITGGPPTAN
jgi:hypothetical protein